MPIEQPGPARDGFHIHVHVLDEKVHIEFGVAVNHIPMPKDSAYAFAVAVFRAWKKVDPAGEMLLPIPGVFFSTYDGQVLVETATEISELILSASEARMLALKIMDMIAKLEGKPLRLAE